MEILNPSPPPSPSIDRFTGVRAHGRILGSAASSASTDGIEGRLHVAVGRSPEKTLGLLRWAFRRFRCTEIGLLHVHQPSPVIPTLLGKMPVNKANEEVVTNHRRTEKEETKKILLSYLSYCHKNRVQASVIVTETDQIHNGILDLVNQYGIRMLVMGSTPDNCFKLKGSSSKATFMAKYTPPFCEIWFVSKGRHIWTREASSASAAVTANSVSVYSGPTDDTTLKKRLRFSLLNAPTNSNSDPTLELDSAMDQTESVDNIDNVEEPASPTELPPSWPDSPDDGRFSSKIISKEYVCESLKEVMSEAERSRKTAFAELVRRKEIESQLVDTLTRVKASESSLARETKQREGLMDLLQTARSHHEQVANQRDQALKELDSVMTKLSLLDSCAKDLSLHHDEAAAELEVLQSSIEILLQERSRIPQKGDGRQFERRTTCGGHARSSPKFNFIGLGDDSYNFREFSAADIQAATCDFSESFKLGQGGQGCVYKGEIMDRSVAIKKLNPRNVQGLMEFQQEVYVLSKLRHPHLVTLVGACPESLSLVYEYLPNGSLHDSLFPQGKNLKPSLTWRDRVRIVSEIARALYFLHSSKPDKIVHGDLKPENILLDSNFRTKISDFGISRLVPEDMIDLPLFGRSASVKGSFPYADPELQRSKTQTPRSDVYSFGIIVLQVLTGRPPLGLPNEVRRALLSEKLSSVLDRSAGNWPADVARRLAEFALQCCEMNRRDRPELTPEVVRELEQLHLMRERTVPSFFLCPILQEIMNDPQVAADGFTYEGRALRDWLENGRETSPMTNLKLKHLNLTPNHALRFAIQDWLCHS